MLPYTTPKATVQELLLKYYTFSDTSGNHHVQKVLHRLMTCRTAALGYHVYQCSDQSCSYIKYQYHSCRDRHCPACGALKKQAWIEARMQELLPVKYYHVVFTLPHELNSLVLGHRKLLFKLLFDASAQTLLSFARDKKYLGAVPGIISVLHTWGQQLSFHPHIHSIISGGGIIDGCQWKEASKNSYSFLFPLKAMQTVFRANFLQSLQHMIASGEVQLPAKTDGKRLLNILYQKDWIIYAKAPFGGPHAVIEYLGRYTHKVAISNHRICDIGDDGAVTFDYKDYADANKKKQMTISSSEFIRRFEQHILPKGFTKIRTYGYLSNRNRHRKINEVLRKMELPLHKPLPNVPAKVQIMERYGIDITVCPCCKNKTLQLVHISYPWKLADDG
jgi:hypothetical protein